MKVDKKVFNDPREAVAENMFKRHFKKEGFIVFRDQSQELVITLNKNEAIELSKTIETAQRKGNFSPGLRELNRKLLEYLKNIGYYHAGHQEKPDKAGQQR